MELHKRLCAVVGSEGSVRAAARALGCPRNSVWRARRGDSLRPSTIALLRAALTKNDAPEGAEEEQSA